LREALGLWQHPDLLPDPGAKGHVEMTHAAQREATIFYHGTKADDPNLTDRKFPGNPTKSYRTREPLRITDEVTAWQGHTAEQLQAMHDHLDRLRQLGVEAIEE
jgi:hypothetical protein